MLMTVYCALNNDTAVDRDVALVGLIAGEIACLECGGTGDWTPFHPEPPPEGVPCIDCKGTGRMLVSV
jgi:hypothetical protein